MKEKYYTSERNTQILISLMKSYGIRKIVASPGATNVCFVGSVQQDDYFEIYSSVDERSAAYIACGLAAESGEPVALSCTGATASRNYPPGLTEAFYRKLPVLAITSTQYTGRVGHLIPQVIDRSEQFADIVRKSVQIPALHGGEDEWYCNTAINQALSELTRQGGGPVHINLQTTYSRDFSIKVLPDERRIQRFGYMDELPVLKNKRIGVFVGAHPVFTKALQDAVDSFCGKYNAVVFCDHTSNYDGAFKVSPVIVCSQFQYQSPLRKMDVLIHLGEVSGSDIAMDAAEIWRVSPDGEMRDRFQALRYVFEMREEFFFTSYAKQIDTYDAKNDLLTEWENEITDIRRKIPDLPFSNAWMAQQTLQRLPEKSVLHLAILNSLRTWNFFEKPHGVPGYANTGGFGIDGAVSTLMGGALADRDKMHIGVIGDLAFFYDINVLGNRHFPANIRILLVNNGRGTEFRNYNHPAERFGEDADRYMAAAGHFGNQSRDIVKHYVEDLGFIYLTADDKNTYLSNLESFLSVQGVDKPVIFEVFTDSQNESDAIRMLNDLKRDARGNAKVMIKNVFGEDGVSFVKRLTGKQ